MRRLASLHRYALVVFTVCLSLTPLAAVAQEGETGSLSFQHWDCEGPVSDATTDDLVESCTASVDPSTWELNGEPLEVGDGYAAWNGLALDTVMVTSGAAATKDDTASAVYCSIALVDSEPMVAIQVPVTEGAIALVFDQPATVYCNWFVAP